jgi:hypothetical protein
MIIMDNKIPKVRKSKSIPGIPATSPARLRCLIVTAQNETQRRRSAAAGTAFIEILPCKWWPESRAARLFVT